MKIAHVVIAEDDPDTRELLDLVLRRAGFRVSVTDDAFQLLSVLAADQVDVLLLDYQMPNMSGIELCGVIRSFNREVPIFFCSGAVTESDKKAAFAAGAQGYITKPFDADVLSATLKAALKVG
jgi:DNA-binding response OmpR family regulator